MADDPVHRRLLFGLGPASSVDEIVIQWPNQTRTIQRFGPLTANHSYRLIEGVPEPQVALSPRIRKRD